MRARWIAGLGMAAFFALFASTGIHAQERQEQKHEHHWDNQHPRFDDHEREAVRGWAEKHHDHPVVGFRSEDRLPADWDGRLAVGFTLDNDWRRRVHPVPEDLMVELPAPPPGYRYYVIGGHIVLVDRDWRVTDVIKINF